VKLTIGGGVMKKVEVHVFTHKCNGPICRYCSVDYHIKLKEKYAEIELITFVIHRNPYKWRVLREYLLGFLLSLNLRQGNMRIEDFITLASYIFPEDYHIRLQSLEEVDEFMHLENFVKLLHSEHKAGNQIDGWKGLMVKRKPRMFDSHSIFYNPFWFDYRRSQEKSKLIESSSGEVEGFLNMLYEISPELIKRYVEKVEIDEDEPEQWARIYLSKKLRKCIQKAFWSREIDLISASDTIRYSLKYDKSCIERLADSLNA
jgi:thiamine kinase-like enzyme